MFKYSNYSPGHSAMYCTYTLMHHETLEILGMEILDKRHADGKSPNMEVKAFEMLLDKLLAKGIKVVEIVTDQHICITALMSKFLEHCNGYEELCYSKVSSYTD